MTLEQFRLATGIKVTHVPYKGVPDVPALSEGAVPGLDWDQWYGMFAPAKTPRAIVNQHGGIKIE